MNVMIINKALFSQNTKKARSSAAMTTLNEGLVGKGVCRRPCEVCQIHLML